MITCDLLPRNGLPRKSDPVDYGIAPLDHLSTPMGRELLLYPHCLTGMIRKLKAGGYRLYSRKLNPKTGKRRNLGTFSSLAAAKKHEREIQYFKRH